MDDVFVSELLIKIKCLWYNRGMIRLKGGFTLIEVSLFLAITGLLFLGVTIGVQNSIFQQRYNDSVQSFVEFLRSAYAKTENVQGVGDGTGGKSGKAMYGKLITFGETCGLESRSGNCVQNENGDVFIYDIIGNASYEGGSSSPLGALSKCGADVVDGDGELAGMAESFKPKWSAAIQGVGSNSSLYKGSILITRHPQSGTVYTYVNDEAINVNQARAEGKKVILLSHLGSRPPEFTIKQTDFCINPNGNQESNVRADVRLRAGARNASAVETIFDDGNLCVGT